MTDKEKFIKLFDDIKIKYKSENLYKIIHNLEDVEENFALTTLNIDRTMVNDWDIEEYINISIEFDKNDNFVQFKLKGGDC